MCSQSRASRARDRYLVAGVEELITHANAVTAQVNTAEDVTISLPVINLPAFEMETADMVSDASKDSNSR